MFSTRMAMFSPKKPDEYSSAEAPRSSSGGSASGGATVIAYGVKVEGDFSSQGDVSIEGEVHGSVKVSGRLSVGPQAMLKANVTADQATIAGDIHGNVTVSGHLQLASTAKITGDVTCATAGVDSGASLNGKVAMGTTANAQASKPSGS
jgi:cytoskeletal protein CcmA (bactofilin family)